MNLKSIATRYLEMFAAKDLDGLDGFFADDTSLRDWDVSVEGKAAVLGAVKDIFDSVDTIEFFPEHVYADGHTVVVEFRFVINGSDELLITDVIGFDDAGKIKFVRAYKGN